MSSDFERGHIILGVSPGADPVVAAGEQTELASFVALGFCRSLLPSESR